MLEITKEQYKKIKQLDPKQFYKSNLQGMDIKNPVLGNILFTQLGLGETFHRTKRNLRPFICLLKDLVETGNCDGVLEDLYKPRKDRIVGFYHIKNTIKLSFIKVALDILIGQDQDGKKYYMFKKDPQGYLGEDFSSQRGPSRSNLIINENEENVNPQDDEIENDFKGLKVGDKFWIGDYIKIEVLSIDRERINENMENTTFKVKLIRDDGSDEIIYDSNFYIENGILYYLDEEIARDVEDDLLYAVEKIVEFCNDTVLEIADEDGEVIYKNDEYVDDENIVATFGADDDKPNYIRDIDFEESFKKYNETLKKALGE